MMNERPRGLFARFSHLVRGMFGVWLRRTERQNPAAVYEQAISERTRQYRELKEAVAGILYMRNKLEAEINERRVEIARLHDDIRAAIRRGQDELSLGLIENKQTLMDDLDRAERELQGVRQEAEEAKANLVRFREEIRSLTREKGRMLATLANANARRRLTEAIDGLSVDADMKALESVRDHVARMATERQLDREIGGDDDTRRRLRAIRDDVRHEAARRELEELKQSLRPRVAEQAESVVPVPAPEAVPVATS
ncbi:MAG: PspA/IM30 family protein [Myxococcota bacterium]